MQKISIDNNVFELCNERALVADKSYFIKNNTELFCGSYYGRTFTNYAIFHGCKFYKINENQEIVLSDHLGTEMVVPLDKIVAYRTMKIVMVEMPNYISARLLHDLEEVGHFDIDYKTNTASMGIGIDDAYQKNGYSKQLIRAVCKEVCFPDDKKIYIDTDASEGFWNHVGLIVNPLYDFTEDQRDLEGAGYEKFITFDKLKMFVNDE